MAEELTELQKKDLVRLRVKKEFEDGNSKGTILIDEVSGKTFLEFRESSRKYAGNKDGAMFTCLVQMFLAEKTKQKILEDEPNKEG